MKAPIEDESTREIFELADGMRHWWNDDNPEPDQLEAYEALRTLGQVLEHEVYRNDPPLETQIKRFESYVTDLEACVAELYSRYERGEILEAYDCTHCGAVAENHWCQDLTQTFE